MLRKTQNPSNSKGLALLAAIIAINIFVIFMLVARTLWETEINRDLEEELIFRAGQYVNAIEMYRKKNNNLSPKNFKVLIEKKFLRKLYKDPVSETGEWDLVMQSTSRPDKSLLIIPKDFVPKYINIARIIGVISTSNEESFREYRKKKRYNEWAFYVGENKNKEMPELKFINK